MRNLILIATLMLSACGGHVGDGGECVLQPKEHVDAPQWGTYDCSVGTVPEDEYTCVDSLAVSPDRDHPIIWFCDRPGTGSVLNYRSGN